MVEIVISSGEFDEVSQGYKIAKFARVKHKNEIWEFHKNDNDPFPSSPHGHNYEKKQKLDINTGKVYNLQKGVVRILKGRELIKIREVLRSKGFSF